MATVENIEDVYIILNIQSDPTDLLQNILNLNYNKSSILLEFYIINNKLLPESIEKIYGFVGRYVNIYKSINVQEYPDDTNISILEHSITSFLDLKLESTLYCYWEDQCFIQNPETLDFLIKKYIYFKEDFVIAPLLVRKGKYWSNFWGALDSNGFYAKSEYYNNIVDRDIKGTYYVPYISGLYICNYTTLLQLNNYKQKELNHENIKHYDEHMLFCYKLRHNNIKMVINNELEYGYLKNYQEEDKEEKEGQEEEKEEDKEEDKEEEKEEIISLIDYQNNNQKWCQKYLDPDFLKALVDNDFSQIIKEVTNDVYVFPFVTKAFCQELIEISDASQLWTGGITQEDPHSDNRIGGYENHPTDDIHLNQIGMEQTWKQMVNGLVSQIANYCYTGYATKNINISFIVRYTMDHQKELGPHHDSSTYTINIALNSDYEGGGCEFIRQNYKHTNTPIGYATIHPGKLTHYHRGIPITSGQRYILVSFIN